MIGRRAVIGLSLLCALVACAFAAPNAMAEKGTTAYTCKPETKPTEKTKGFEDEHCTKAVEGSKVNFVHEELPFENFTKLSVTNNETTSKSIPAKFKTTIEKKLFEAEATAFIGCAEGSSVTNRLNGFGEMTSSGTACGEFTGVTVKEPKKCSVPKNIITLEGAIWTGLVESAEMWLKFVPEAGLPLAEFEISGAECPLNGKKVEVAGWASTERLKAASPLDGATVKFTTKRTGMTLEAGGEVAEFEGTFTPRMWPEDGKPTNPIALTTTDK
jgi:hypothetical protein